MQSAHPAATLLYAGPTLALALWHAKQSKVRLQLWGCCGAKGTEPELVGTHDFAYKELQSSSTSKIIKLKGQCLSPRIG